MVKITIKSYQQCTFFAIKPVENYDFGFFDTKLVRNKNTFLFVFYLYFTIQIFYTSTAAISR